MEYTHDEWCDMDNKGICDCYVSLLTAKDEEIRRLKEYIIELEGIIADFIVSSE